MLRGSRELNAAQVSVVEGWSEGIAPQRDTASGITLQLTGRSHLTRVSREEKQSVLTLTVNCCCYAMGLELKARRSSP
jgi:hypothetical protein